MSNLFQDKLLLTIDIQVREYQPILTTEVGIRVLIQDQDFVILPDKMGVSIPPGASASISIRKVILQSCIYFIL